MQAAEGRPIPDVIAPGLKILFCGINPGLYSAVAGYHFARPGNRFWKVLHLAGYTERRLAPAEQTQLLARGYGLTNLVERSTARATDISNAELAAGAEKLVDKAAYYQPELVAVLGIGAYRTAFERPGATPGRQPHKIGPAGVWLLPNPSGLNAHYQLTALADLFRELRLSVAEGNEKRHCS
jgi:TDG/mug DNA glycosylase family protein